jgi:hypothetical protein
MVEIAGADTSSRATGGGCAAEPSTRVFGTDISP